MFNVYLTSALSESLEKNLETKIAVHQIAFLQETLIQEAEKGLPCLDSLELSGMLKVHDWVKLSENWNFSNFLQFWYLEKGSNKVDYYGSEEYTGESFCALSLIFPSVIHPHLKKVWASFTKDEEGNKHSVLMLPEDY